MSDTPLLELRGVSKAFGSVQALTDVDLEVRNGEVMALVGDNGAGKSTLIKGIAGIHSFDGGEDSTPNAGRRSTRGGDAPARDRALRRRPAATAFGGAFPSPRASAPGGFAHPTRVCRSGGRFEPRSRSPRLRCRSPIRRSAIAAPVLGPTVQVRSLLTRGIPVQIVAARLRHASPVTTMRVYAHVLRTSDVHAAELVGDLFAR